MLKMVVYLLLILGQVVLLAVRPWCSTSLRC
jgi:hypothetical protein